VIESEVVGAGGEIESASSGKSATAAPAGNSNSKLINPTRLMIALLSGSGSSISACPERVGASLGKKRAWGKY
jgi:hypothetical protein